MIEEPKDARVEDLQRWMDATEVEIGQLSVSIAELERRLLSARARLDLLRKLIKLAENPASLPGSLGSEPSRVDESTQSEGRDVESHLEEVLTKAARPMHIAEIRQALIEKGVPLPGRGDEANIILRLRRAPGRFTRTGRGTYALASLGLTEVLAEHRRRRARARRSR